jgi:hypothetical protein
MIWAIYARRFDNRPAKVPRCVGRTPGDGRETLRGLLGAAMSARAAEKSKAKTQSYTGPVVNPGPYARGIRAGEKLDFVSSSGYYGPAERAWTLWLASS